MELSLHNPTMTQSTAHFFRNLSQATQQVFQPFLDQTRPTSKVQPFIMPLELVQKRLHQHYVSQAPLTITYEYYDRGGHIHQVEACVRVIALADGDRYHLVSEDDQLDRLLSIQQILRVR